MKGIITPEELPLSTHVYHQYTLKVLDGKRDVLKQHLADAGIPSMIYYPLPLQQQEAFQTIARAAEPLDTAEKLAYSVLSLPIHTELSTEQQDLVINSIKDFFNKYSMQDYFAHETATVDDGCRIGAGTKIWHYSHIMTGCVLGERCNIGQNVVISPDVVLGNNVKVQNNVSVYTGVTCEDDVFLGPSCVFTNVINPRSAVNRKSEYAKTRVGKGATIGANATIVCGHDIGEFAFIGAGAVVTKTVPPYALLVGNPARQIGWMSEHGYRLEFDERGIAECLESKECYQLRDGKVFKM